MMDFRKFSCLGALFLALAVFVMVSPVQANQASNWELCFGASTGIEKSYDVASTSENGAMTAGDYYSGGYPYFHLEKFSQWGSLLHSKKFGYGTGSQTGSCYGVERARGDDEYYYISGRLYYDGNHLYVAKLNCDLSVIWDKVVEDVPSGIDVGACGTNASPNEDGGCTVCSGKVQSGQNQDFWVIKFDAAGNVEWQKSLGTSGFEFVWSAMEQTVDTNGVPDGYVMAAYTSVTGYGLLVIRTDMNGNILWHTCFGIGYSVTSEIHQTSDGGFILVNEEAKAQVRLIKLDSTGTVSWVKLYGDDWYPGVLQPSVIESKNHDGFLVATSCGDYDDTTKDAWLFKVDQNGDYIWQKKIGNDGCVDRFYRVDATADNGAIAAGWTKCCPGGHVDNLLAKVGEDGEVDVSSCDCCVADTAYPVVDESLGLISVTTHSIVTSYSVAELVINISDINTTVDIYSSCGCECATDSDGDGIKDPNDPDPAYILHVGLSENGCDDIFPRENAAQAEYSGAAAARQTIRWMWGEPQDWMKYDDDPNALDQAAMWTGYHNYYGDNTFDDFNVRDMRACIQAEKPSKKWDGSDIVPSYAYNFVREEDDDELLAIRRFIHWFDFNVNDYYSSYPQPVVDNPNVPSLVVTDTDDPEHYRWMTLRGFVTNDDPCDEGNVFNIPDVTVYGMWFNDPSIGGLGANYYITSDDFRDTVFNQVDGKYRSVCEPPEDLDVQLFNQNLQASSRINLVGGKQSAKLSMAMATMGSAEERGAEFDEVNWEDVIPGYLMASPDFNKIYSNCSFSGTLEVDDLKTGDAYQLVTFSQGTEAEFQPIEKKVCRLSKTRIDKSYPTASIVLLVNKEDGEFRQATWVAEDEKYLLLTEDEAVTIAGNAVGKELKRIDAQPVPIGKMDERGDTNVRLVYNEDCSSGFLPMYEVTMEDGTIVRVMQDGTYIIVYDGSLGYLTADVDDLTCCGVATEIDPVMAGQIESYACEDHIESCAPIGPNCLPMETAQEIINASPTDSWHIVPNPVGVVVPCP